MVSPVQPAKSCRVVGPWLRKYRTAMVASASSRSSRTGSGTHSSSSTKVCSVPTFGAMQVTPRWLAYQSRW